MDDKELIKRIMEEVKDEKLREELLALVVEKNRKREEERPIDYLARQAILGGATEDVAKLGWKIAYIFFSLPVIILGPVALFLFLAFLFALFNKDVREALYHLFIAILVSIPALIGSLGVYSLRSGKREYERLKRKRENQGQS